MEINELYTIFLASEGVNTDTRTLRPGQIFVALKGENFDGNDYALQALEAGASYVIANDYASGDDPRILRFPDSLQTLKELAACHRKYLEIPVIGLTGTNGKTTTKELIRTVLSSAYRVAATQGNLNNDIGVPLTVLSIGPDAEIAVVEMGASHPDDISALTWVSQPDYGLITNVGRAHLLGFGSFEGVKAAKGELYKWLGSHRGSVIFLNEDDPDLRAMAAQQPCHTFGYGIAAQGAQILPATPEEPFLRIRLGDALIRTQLVGAYNATNVLAALAVGDYFGVSRADAIAAIAAFAPDNNRSQMVRTQANTLIVDAYNANPSSMRAALDNFRHVQAPRKLALLGDMRELGEESLAEHRKVVRQLRGDGLQACLVGEEFRRALESLEPGDEPWFADSAALAAHLTAHPVRDTVVLVKGSRGIQMEKVLPTL